MALSLFIKNKSYKRVLVWKQVVFVVLTVIVLLIQDQMPIKTTWFNCREDHELLLLTVGQHMEVD